MCKPLGSTCNIHPLLHLCIFCGNTWICNRAIRCPVCNSGNIRIVPIPKRNHPLFNLGWLNRNGFGYIEERLECII